MRGLEPEVQKLVAMHKAELKKAEQAWEAEAVRRLQAASAQHEEQVARLKAAAAAEVAAAAAAERAAAQRAAEETAQRFEGELCALRLRLAAEHQVALERAEGGRREDRALHEERGRQMGREHEQHVAALRAKWEEDCATAAARHQRELAAVREEAAMGQEAWRAAVSERAAREMEAREAALRKKLAAERDEELRAVVGRLEEESMAKEQQLEERAEAAEAAAEARVRDELGRARREGDRAAERTKLADARCERLESLLLTLQQDVAGKSATIARLEEAAAAASSQAAREQKQAARALSGREEVLAALEVRAAAAEDRAAGAERQVGEAAAKAEKEIGTLETRVSAALANKDATIAALRRQLDDLHAAC